MLDCGRQQGKQKGLCPVTGATITRYSVVFGAVAVLLAACSPEVGGDERCNDMKEKATGDWTANEAADFAKHCVLK